MKNYSPSDFPALTGIAGAWMCKTLNKLSENGISLSEKQIDDVYGSIHFQLAVKKNELMYLAENDKLDEYTNVIHNIFSHNFNRVLNS
jgi:hypothetical protein